LVHLPNDALTLLIESPDRARGGRISWIVSILLHAGLLALGVAWLTQPARFHVNPGQTSTELDLLTAPAPVPVRDAASLPPPTPEPPVRPAPFQTALSPLPLVKLALLSKPASAAIVPKAKLVPSSPVSATALSTRAPPAKRAVKSKRLLITAASQLSRGAIQAQPDDLQNEPPEYPDASRIAREQGVVILKVEVTATGTPATVGILQSSGFFRLDQAARQAVRHWKFHPALIAGIPVSSEATVPVRFKLQP
jgi:protein TonB